MQLRLCELRSRGLSFQIWPAAYALCWFLEEIFGDREMMTNELPHLRQCLQSSMVSLRNDRHGFLASSRSPPSPSPSRVSNELKDTEIAPDNRGLDENAAHRVFDLPEDRLRSADSVPFSVELPSSGCLQNADVISQALFAQEEHLPFVLASSGCVQNSQRTRQALFAQEEASSLEYVPFSGGREATSPTVQHGCAGKGKRDKTLLVNCGSFWEHTESQHALVHCNDMPDAPSPLRVLELGAGTGMVGLLSAVLGAHATVTDLPHVIPNLIYNASLNEGVIKESGRGGCISVQTLRWGEHDDLQDVGRAFDVILASDVVYYDHLFEPLLCTLQWLLSEEESTMGNEFPSLREKHLHSPFVLLAHVRRWKKDSQFFKKASRLFHVRQVRRYLHPANPRTGVAVYCITRKG